MGSWIDERTNEWMDEWVDGPRNRGINARSDRGRHG